MHDTYSLASIGQYIASLMALLGLLMLVWILTLRLAPTPSFRRLRAMALVIYGVASVLSLLPLLIGAMASNPAEFQDLMEMTTSLSAIAILAAIVITAASLFAAAVTRLRA